MWAITARVQNDPEITHLNYQIGPGLCHDHGNAHGRCCCIRFVGIVFEGVGIFQDIMQ